MPSDYGKIRDDNILEYGQGTRHLSFLGRLYTDRTHFVFELLQNAEDAGASQILFKLFDDRLEVTHDGRPFNEPDVRGVCGVGEGTKAEDLTQIGKFGIGFKSVYAYTSRPEVHSGDESFRIENYVRPYPVASRRVANSGTTLFVFPFDAVGIDSEAACREIGERLRNLSARTLLFLRKIDEIEYKLPDLTGGVYRREESARSSARQVTVIGQNNGEDEDENWLIFERPVPVPDGSYQVYIEVGFRLETSAENATKGITRIKDAPLVVYFPTEKATRFGFLIQGPYRTTPSRDNIRGDDDWNTTLVRETAKLLAHVLPLLKELGLLTVSLLEALPIRMDNFPKESMFYPIVVAIRKALLDEDLLPTDDGTFVSARNAKLARGADLRKLLNQDQLRLLFPPMDTVDTVKWLAEEITQDRTLDLHAYLLNELHVEEVTPDGFARKITQSFLASQTDEWFIRFYGYLSDQEALWRSPRWAGDKGGILRAAPILRLQDGKQISPFQPAGTTPNAFLPPPEETDFPIVKRSIANDEKVKDFLKRLGLSEPDVFDDIVRVLPKYTGPEALSISPNEHTADIQKILRALRADSEAGKKKVIGVAKQTPFLKAVDQNGRTAFQKPEDIYFPTQELRDYFSGSPDIWFLDEPEGEEEWRELGVRDDVRVDKKRPDRGGFIEIRKSLGRHERGLNEFDPEIKVDGLEHALASPLVEKSMFVWNRIAIPHCLCIRGKVEKCSRQTYENSSKEDRVSEKFGRLLIEKPWLPGLDGSFQKPSELRLDDLPEQFEREKKLADLLGMKKDDVATLAEKAGIPPEYISLLLKCPKKFEEWIDWMAGNEKPTFPTRRVTDPERRKEKLRKDYAKAPVKKYEERERSVRTTRGDIDPSPWLREQYTNNAGQMVCQICKEEMPFKKRDGEYYFEAVEALSKDYFSKEHEAQFLALCPLCAARYKEFVKRDESDKSAMKDLNCALKNSEEPELPLNMGGLETSIRFVETHFHDIKTILRDTE